MEIWRYRALKHRIDAQRRKIARLETELQDEQAYLRGLLDVVALIESATAVDAVDPVVTNQHEPSTRVSPSASSTSADGPRREER